MPFSWLSPGPLFIFKGNVSKLGLPFVATAKKNCEKKIYLNFVKKIYWNFVKKIYWNFVKKTKSDEFFPVCITCRSYLWWDCRACQWRGQVSWPRRVTPGTWLGVPCGRCRPPRRPLPRQTPPPCRAYDASSAGTRNFIGYKSYLLL